LYVNGPEAASTVTTSDGTFQIENIGLINGRNTIFAKAIDASGNESDKSTILNLEVDKDKPKLEIEEPKDEDVIKNLNKRVLIKGKVSEKASIKINDKPAVLRPDLSFEMLLGVEPGKVDIVITATDEAGNEEKEEFTITYVVSS
ncbi:MAG: hypothetical protein KC414_04195, partial [Romboutsia sp.]|nr:hypothetical protein [Romboutsia sp.]